MIKIYFYKVHLSNHVEFFSSQHKIWIYNGKVEWVKSKKDNKLYRYVPAEQIKCLNIEEDDIKLIKKIIDNEIKKLELEEEFNCVI